MLRQSPSRSNRSKKLVRPRHSFQAFLLFAVGIWIVYQLTRSYGKRRGVVVVETDDGDAIMNGGDPAARRRLGRKGFVGLASDDADIVAAGVGGQGAGWDAASIDESLSKAEDRDGDEEDQEAGEDDADDDLAGDEEDDDRDLLLSPNDDTEDEMESLLGESDQATMFGNGGTGLHDQGEPKELNGSAVQRAEATARVQDAAASQQTNATEGRASATPLTDSPLKNGSSVNLSLHERGNATAEKLVANDSAVGVGAENEKNTVPVEDNRKETADAVAGQGTSS